MYDDSRYLSGNTCATCLVARTKYDSIFLKLRTWLDVVGSHFPNDVVAGIDECLNQNDDSVIRLSIAAEFQTNVSQRNVYKIRTGRLFLGTELVLCDTCTKRRCRISSIERRQTLLQQTFSRQSRFNKYDLQSGSMSERKAVLYPGGYRLSLKHRDCILCLRFQARD
mmetsp:Transcript_14662/g.16625  ORF Transcript_14662/g.16625 Transcript_14662/m.16625 type:complete len:167 (-) Transcript_14662:131-631(-)